MQRFSMGSSSTAILSLVLLLHATIIEATFDLPWSRALSLIKRATPNELSTIHKREDDPRFFEFKTRPDIGSPKWDLKFVDKSAIASGYYFIAPYAKLDQVEYPLWNGPHIYDSSGDLIWSGAPLFEHRNTFDFRVITYDGRPALSLIDPKAKHKSGVILNSSYEIQHTVDLRGELDETNMHDFTVVDDGKHALTLTSVPGGSSLEESLKVGYEGECNALWQGFKEVDVDTSSVVFDWNPHGRIGLEESTKLTNDQKCKIPWDILHLNSIDKFPDGDYLLSSRFTDTIYKISHVDGSILWRLGGNSSDFAIEKNSNFTRQHHARVQSQNATNTVISLFDNAKAEGTNEPPKSNKCSRGMLLNLRTDLMTAEMLQHYDHPHKRISNSRGSVQFLPNRNALVCYTYGSLVAEFDHNGTMLMEGRLQLPTAHTYRAYKFPWIGQPSKPPDVVSRGKGFVGRKQTAVYMSWNGATEVASWNVYKASAAGDREEPVGVPRHGFESTITFDGHVPFVVAEAFDSTGNFLGTSDLIETIPESAVGAFVHSVLRDHVSLFFAAVVVTVFVVYYLRFSRSRKSGWINWSRPSQRYELLDNAHEDVEFDRMEHSERRNEHREERFKDS